MSKQLSSDPMHDKRVTDTVMRHIGQLRDMASRGQISDTDHDAIGIILRDHIGHLIGLSGSAWLQFVTIVSESRQVHYDRGDPRKRERLDASNGAPCIRKENEL
jgi:hypothetical protein